MSGEAENPIEHRKSKSLAADGSEACWETTTTLKEDLEAAYKHKEVGMSNDPVVVGPALYEKLDGFGLIKNKP